MINMRVEEIQHIKELCQDQSYYECVASKFGVDTSCKDVKCLPYTLPTNSILEDLEYCFALSNATDEEQGCYHNLLDSKKDVCADANANSCLIKEYNLKDYQPPMVLKEFEEEELNQALFFNTTLENR